MTCVGIKYAREHLQPEHHAHGGSRASSRGAALRPCLLLTWQPQAVIHQPDWQVEADQVAQYQQLHAKVIIDDACRVTTIEAQDRDDCKAKV